MTKEQIQNEINNMSENQLIERAKIGVDNNHRCDDCYTCKCLAELDKRRAVWDWFIDDLPKSEHNRAFNVLGFSGVMDCFRIPERI